MSILIANWKMNGSFEEYKMYLLDIQQNYDFPNTELVIAPPYPYLDYVKKHIAHNSIKIAAQNAIGLPNGARTSCINCNIIKDVGCDYVILGHSEVRLHNGFDTKSTKNTIKECIKNDISVVLCVGEDKDISNADDILIEELLYILGELSNEDSNKIIIGYEPIWAIGTGEIPTSRQIIHKKNIIRATLSNLNLHGAKIIYGGSVSPKNAQDIINAGIDGFIVGKASMNANSTLDLLKIISK